MKDIKLPLKDRNIVITRAKGQISEAKTIKLTCVDIQCQMYVRLCWV